MEFTMDVFTNIDTDAAKSKIMAAAKAALKDMIISVQEQAKINSPVSDMYPSIDKSGRKPTGNNRKSIQSEMGPGGDSNLDEMQGAVYSTSGYGGYLETGTAKMPARPYMYPAAIERITKAALEAKIKEKLGE